MPRSPSRQERAPLAPRPAGAAVALGLGALSVLVASLAGCRSARPPAERLPAGAPAMRGPSAPSSGPAAWNSATAASVTRAAPDAKPPLPAAPPRGATAATRFAGRPLPSVILPDLRRSVCFRAFPAILIAITETRDLVIFQAPGVALRTGSTAWLNFGEEGMVRVRVGLPIGDPRNRKFTGRVLSPAEPKEEKPLPPIRAYEGPEVALRRATSAPPCAELSGLTGPKPQASDAGAGTEERTRS
ncbi:MAG: hypothetical protein HYZ53_05520 [Planctomycetes bacterium]|nr:hypothetical protein [Planctomycetota bacterium]